jgi:hypothetical protein
MLFVVDKPRLQRIISIVGEDRSRFLNQKDYGGDNVYSKILR